jgi:hypothetical protein
MSESDLSNLIYLAMGMSTSVFEYWLSASFAFAIVAYFTAGKFDGTLVKLVSILYLLASIAFLLGWFAFSNQVNDYLVMMVEQGYEAGHIQQYFWNFAWSRDYQCFCDRNNWSTLLSSLDTATWSR